MIFIVNFHGIGQPTRVLEPGEDKVWIGRDEMERILDLIAGRDDVLVTSDDGNKSDIDLLAPALLARQLSGHFFPIAGQLGNAGFLDDADLQGLVELGFRVGSHGYSHRPCQSLACQSIADEIQRSRERICPVAGGGWDECFALPFGSYNRRVLQCLKRVGVRRVFSSDRGWEVDPCNWLLARNSVGLDVDASHIDRQLNQASVSVATRIRRRLKAWR